MSSAAKKLADRSQSFAQDGDGKNLPLAPPLKELDPDKIKVLVNTSFTRPSGERGVPMFSRIGK